MQEDDDQWDYKQQSVDEQLDETVECQATSIDELSEQQRLERYMALAELSQTDVRLVEYPQLPASQSLPGGWTKTTECCSWPTP